jgi:hypothetical protein
LAVGPTDLAAVVVVAAHIVEHTEFVVGFPMVPVVTIVDNVA